jgi:hypothetical protein
VAHGVAEANVDYRDVLYWAEYDGMPDRMAEFARRYRSLRTAQQSNP